MPSHPPPSASLSRRERQIMDVIFRMGRASAAEVHERIPDPPTLTAVRTMLRNLEEKGHLRHEKDGPRHIYSATVERESAERSAVMHLLRTFFGGSPRAAVAALLDASERPLNDREREELVDMIRRERGEGR
jgi:BlaI family transcriptional regulator, penicillinase repressor